MFKRLLGFLLLFTLSNGPTSPYYSPPPVPTEPGSWSCISRALTELKFQLVAADPVQPHHVWVASNQNVYRTQDSGKHWERIFRLRGADRRIHCLFLSSQPPRWIVGTSDGLFLSTDNGRTWDKIFGGIGSAERNVLCFSMNPFNNREWYIGTEKGFFSSTDSGRTWQKTPSKLQNQSVQKMVHHPAQEGLVFLLTPSGIFRSDDDAETLIQTFFDSLSSESSLDETGDERTEENEEPVFDLAGSGKALCFLDEQGTHLLALTQKGLVESTDLGQNWQAFPSYSFNENDGLDLAAAYRMSCVFTATQKGIYQWDGPRRSWLKLSSGLTSDHAFRLALAEGEKTWLYAATDRGAYRLQVVEPQPISVVQMPQPVEGEQIQKLQFVFQQEPSIQATQQAAVRYADVGNSKIQNWHRQSRLKALIPTFSVGADKSIANNVDIDRGGTGDPDRFILGPVDKDFGWDVNLSWDLSELIWSSAQTSIDSREKMMIELRDDILSEVTRLYFERRKLMMELVLYTPQGTREKLELLMRIDELTANLDALTGGWFSRELEKRAHSE